MTVEENTRKDVKALSKDPPITSERAKPTYASMLRSGKSFDRVIGKNKKYRKRM